MASPLSRVRGAFYGWWLVAITSVVMIIGTVPMSQGLTAWIVVLEGQFGWSKAELALAFSLARVGRLHHRASGGPPHR